MYFKDDEALQNALGLMRTKSEIYGMALAHNMHQLSCSNFQRSNQHHEWWETMVAATASTVRSSCLLLQIGMASD